MPQNLMRGRMFNKPLNPLLCKTAVIASVFFLCQSLNSFFAALFVRPCSGKQTSSFAIFG
jgi:hypothetical protein